MKQNRPSFYAWAKDFNTGMLEPIDVLGRFFNIILDKKGNIRKRNFRLFDTNSNSVVDVVNKEQFSRLIDLELKHQFWGKCEYEFIIIDWPCKDTIKDSRPIKIDVYKQIEHNLSLITNIAWDYIQPKINNSK